MCLYVHCCRVCARLDNGNAAVQCNTVPGMPRRMCQHAAADVNAGTCIEYLPQDGIFGRPVFSLMARRNARSLSLSLSPASLCSVLEQCHYLENAFCPLNQRLTELGGQPQSGGKGPNGVKCSMYSQPQNHCLISHNIIFFPGGPHRCCHNAIAKRQLKRNKKT
jgi:hypothetical protein